MKQLSPLYCLVLFLVAAGCAAPGSAGVKAFYSGNPEQAMALLEEDLEGGGKDYALLANSYGSAAMAAGKFQEAKRAFMEGYLVMENYSEGGARETLALVGPEAEKVYKGDPYERAMNSYYVGLLQYMDGDVDNAIAGFKNGNLCDADSKEEKYQSDFGILHFMEGKGYLRLGERETAERSFLHARESEPQNPFFFVDKNLDNNLLILLDLGAGPEKYPTGPHGSLATFRPVPYPEAYAEIVLDGEVLGRTFRAVDLYFQASTRGGRKMDYIQGGKAVMKDAALATGLTMMSLGRSDKDQAIGAGIALFGLLMPAQADVRHWATLPGEVHVFVGRVKPGEHTLRLRFFDKNGAHLPRLDQTYTGVVIPEDSEKVLYFRSGFERCTIE